jgi:hypothetical protein
VSDVIGALAAAEALVSPKRLQAAMSVTDAVGTLLGEPSLIRLLTFRALSSPLHPLSALAALKPAAATLSAPERAALMQELKPLLSGDAKPVIAALASDLAAALGLPLPADPRHDSGIFDAFSSLADRAAKWVRSEDRVLVAVREFAMDFGESRLLALADQAYQTGDKRNLFSALGLTIDAIRERLAAIDHAVEAHEKACSLAEELSKTADKIERVGRQRYASIARRAAMLKRHIREDLDALAEDAAEEFEVDFRRLAEQNKGWFGRIDTSDLNDRLVVKNLERRYYNLARRYQDELDLFDREVSEFCEEFTRISDEALLPMARQEFRAVAPHSALEPRVKAAADRASTRVLAASAVGAASGAAALHAGVVGAGVAAGVAAAPVGIAVLGVIAFAGAWKMFAEPDQRRRRDLRERSQTLRNELRAEMMTKLPRFDETVDAIVNRFGAAVVPDIMQPRVEAKRIREIALAHRAIARGVREAAGTRIERLKHLTERRI